MDQIKAQERNGTFEETRQIRCTLQINIKAKISFGADSVDV